VYAVCQYRSESPKTVQKRAESFASSDIFCASNQSLLYEALGGGVGRGIYGTAAHGEKFVYFLWRSLQEGVHFEKKSKVEI
jgi:hypothetical protein